MANPGFNLKVREVENGFTIHVTRVNSGDIEVHFDHIADVSEIKTKITELTDGEIDYMRKAKG